MENDFVSDKPRGDSITERSRSKHNKRPRSFSKKTVASGMNISVNIKLERENGEGFYYSSEVELKKYYDLYVKLNI